MAMEGGTTFARRGPGNHPARKEIERLKPLVAEILALSAEIRSGTIDHIMEMSDLELGLKALLGRLPRHS
jgi:hypothetical protein